MICSVFSPLCTRAELRCSVFTTISGTFDAIVWIFAATDLSRSSRSMCLCECVDVLVCMYVCGKIVADEMCCQYKHHHHHQHQQQQQRPNCFKWNTFKTVYHQNSFDSHCPISIHSTVDIREAFWILTITVFIRTLSEAIVVFRHDIWCCLFFLFILFFFSVSVET